MLKKTVNLLYMRNLIQQQVWCTTNVQIRNVNEQENKKYFLKDDPNSFGNLNKSVKELVNENYLEDEGDIQEENLLQNPVPKSKQLRTKQYADMIKAYLRKRQIKEAIDLVEIRMLKEDKVKPESYIYNLILGGCGRVGYTKKAFKLFNDMKKRGLNPTNSTYTALFNACANSPWIEDGLSRATKLRELIIEKGVILNDTNYNAMIKAFGRCGDLKTAFSLVDEMLKNNVLIKEDTVNFLLQSCISDKEAGFRHALLVWRKFHQKNIQPDIFSFNLMLRCIRDCGIGDIETMNNLLESPEFKLLENPNSIQIEMPKNEGSGAISAGNQNSVALYNWPNLMAQKPYLGKIVKLNEVRKPDDRLLLVGGTSGFLENMKQCNVKPDIKTFTQLLDCIPSTLVAEKALLSFMKQQGVKFDVDFLNMLIKKRSMRLDYEVAKDVLNMFGPLQLRPDLITYGVLALGCETKEQSNHLIEEMKIAGYRLNIEMLGAMLKQACIRMNFVYIIELMELVIKEEIKPNKMFIQHLENLYSRAKIESNERKGVFFHKGFRLFRMRYKKWLEETQDDAAEDVHPWQQFRETNDTNRKNYKDSNVYFKPRVSSRFKVKTGTRSQ